MGSSEAELCPFKMVIKLLITGPAVVCIHVALIVLVFLLSVDVVPRLLPQALQN